MNIPEKRVLIVDDNPGDRILYREYLAEDSENRYIFTEAETCAEAREKLRSSPVDCILIDFRLPDGDGIELIRQIEEEFGSHRAALVMLTGQGSERIAVEAMQSGAHDYVAKHEISPDSLIRTVQNAIDKAQLLARLEAQRLEIERQNQALAEASLLKSRFLANFGHEIRTPLTGIVGMAEILRFSGLTPDQLKSLDTLCSSAAILGTMIDEILNFSKLEAGRIELEKIPFSVSTLLGEVRDVHLAAALKKGLEFSVDVGPDVHDRLLGDALRIRQILLNLVGNALKFTQTGSVRIRLRRMPGDDAAATRTRVRFEVSDSGIGLSEAAISRLFQPFSQADSSTTRKYGGTGLGLAISKKLVDLMGGAIGVESQPGQGSHFWFELPLEVAADQPTERTASTRPAPGKRPLRLANERPPRILVAEDNEINQQVVSSMLRHLGCEVQVVGSGSAIPQQADPANFDLVLMDCHMPEVDGYTATKNIRRLEASRGNEKSLPIIAMTANSQPGEREKCIEAGMNDFIVKPLRTVNLSEALEKWLTR